MVKAVVDYFGLPYPVYLDQGDATFRTFGAAGTPHWLLFDQQGAARHSIFGSLDGALLRLDYALQEIFSGEQTPTHENT